MFRFIFMAATAALGFGYLNQLPPPDQAAAQLRALLPSPEVLAEKMREVIPPAKAVTAEVIRAMDTPPALPARSQSGGGIAVFEISPPSHSGPTSTPYLGSLNWINGE